jgi:predicted transcriptional regulator
MNLTVHLSPELEAKLREQARATGKPPEDLVLEALQDKLAMPEDASVMLPRSIWKQEFQALLESMPDGNVDADLSRASVYEGRGE